MIRLDALASPLNNLLMPRTIKHVALDPLKAKFPSVGLKVGEFRDMVTVVIPRERADPKDPSKTYTTSWFDMWRFVGGKADEHWDPATK